MDTFHFKPVMHLFSIWLKCNKQKPFLPFEFNVLWIFQLFAKHELVETWARYNFSSRKEGLKKNTKIPFLYQTRNLYYSMGQEFQLFGTWANFNWVSLNEISFSSSIITLADNVNWSIVVGNTVQKTNSQRLKCMQFTLNSAFAFDWLRHQHQQHTHARQLAVDWFVCPNKRH